MEAIPLFLASASKAILLGAVVPEMTSQDGAPNVLDSTGVGDGAAAVAVAPAEAAPMAPEPQVAHVDLPVPPPSEPVQPVHPVQAVPSAETTVTTTVTTPGATDSATSGEAAGAATDATDATAVAGAADAAGAGAEGGAAGADASAGNSLDAASAAVQAVHGESESAAPSALKADAQQIVEAVNAKVKDLSKASFASQTEPTHPHAPVMDETTSMMYVTQKIHDYFSGRISPSDVSSVVKESVTVLREFDKLNEWSTSLASLAAHRVMGKGYLMADGSDGVGTCQRMSCVYEEKVSNWGWAMMGHDGPMGQGLSTYWQMARLPPSVVCMCHINMLFKGLRLTAGRRPSNLGTILALSWPYVGCWP